MPHGLSLELRHYRRVGNGVLRPFLLLALVLAFLGGPVFGSQASAAGTDCSHAATDVDSSGSCGASGMATAACAINCGLGACIPSAAAVFQPSVPARQLTSETSLPAGDRPSPPDPAPPKA